MALHFKDGFFICVLVMQFLNILFAGVFTDYEYINTDDLVHNPDKMDMRVAKFYPFFSDVTMMMLMGFGYLMTFLRRYSFSSVGFNFLITAMAIQWGSIVVGFFTALSTHAWKITFNLPLLINGDFAAAACLITMGGVLGKVSPLQLLVLTWFEIIFYAINLYICQMSLKAADMGGSIFIHTFGAYFGLAATYFLSSESSKDHSDNSSRYSNDIFAMIGTILLWLYWPSFNGALAPGYSQHRSIINTVCSLCSCVVVSFAFSRLFRGHYKFDMVDIQNATLAGGVGVGACADLRIHPFGAMLIGACAGILSTGGFAFLQGYLLRKIKLHDTCGIHNLHGMPGLLGGFASVIASGVAYYQMVDYGATYDEIFHHGGNQPWFQLAAIVITLLIAIGSGSLVALFVHRFVPGNKEHYSDEENWAVPSDFPASNVQSSNVELSAENTTDSQANIDIMVNANAHTAPEFDDVSLVKRAY